MRKKQYLEKSAVEKKEMKEKDIQEKEKRVSDIIKNYLDETSQTGSFASIRWTRDNLNPESISSGETYKGGNAILLTQRIISENWEDNRFISHKKLSSINFERQKEEKDKITVKEKGEFTTPIKFVSITYTEDYYKELLKNENLAPEQREKYTKKLDTIIEREKETGIKPYFKNIGYHSLYNLSQLNPEILEYFPEKKADTNLQMGTEAYTNYLIKALKETSHVPIVELKLSDETAFRGNKITMPPQENFVNDRYYLATLAHEISHSIKSENEKENTKNNFKLDNIQNYAVEEMKAEMSAGITLVKLGINIESQDSEKNIFGTNKAYIQHYAKSIKSHEKLNDLFKEVAGSALERSDKILERVKEYEKTYSFEDFKKDYNYDDEIEILNQGFEEKELEKYDDKKLHFYSLDTIQRLIDDSLSKVNFRFQIEDVDMNNISHIDEVTRSTADVNNEAIQNTEFPTLNEDTLILEAKKDKIDAEEKIYMALSDDSMRKLNATFKAYTKMLNKSEAIITVPKEDFDDYKFKKMEFEKRELDFKGIEFDEEDFLNKTNDEYLEKYKNTFLDKLVVVAQMTITENKTLSNAEKELDFLGDMVNEPYNKIAFEYSPNELMIQKIATSLGNIIKETQEYENRKEYNDEIGLEVTDEIFEKKTLLKILEKEDNIINHYMKDDNSNFKAPSEILEKNRLAYYKITNEQKELAISEKIGVEKELDNKIEKNKEKEIEY